MKLKSLLIGSAALAAATTGARAADIIVAPEPEPMEYVRVCDVYGAGFFYIPGTETCLKISGMIRYEIGAASDIEVDGESIPGTGTDGWDKFLRAEVNFDARSETEYGTLGAWIKLRGQTSPNDGPILFGDDSGINEGNALSTGWDSNVFIQEAIISLGGLSLGFSDTLYDADLSGEFDEGGGDRVHFIGYTFAAGNGFTFALNLEEADGFSDDVVEVTNPITGEMISAGAQGYDWVPNVVGKIGVAQGWGSVDFWAAYDATAEEFALKAIANVDLTERLWVEAIATYESGPSWYSVAPFEDPFDRAETTLGLGSEWSAGGLIGYEFTPKLSASIGAQYFGGWGHDDFDGEADALTAGTTIDYEIVENFDAKLAVNYEQAFDVPNGEGEQVDLDRWTGFLRFQRNF